MPLRAPRSRCLLEIYAEVLRDENIQCLEFASEWSELGRKGMSEGMDKIKQGGGKLVDLFGKAD